jgi:chaperonin GroEL (HSP60 family)
MDAMEDGKFVVGGGSVETELLLKIHDYANSVGGRIQIAIEAFAGVFETIPRTLAENSGFNSIDKVVELKTAHAKGKRYMGLNVYTGIIEDMKKLGVFEPMRVKTQAIISATEAATMLTRIDDMMVTQKKTEAPSAPPMG